MFILSHGGLLFAVGVAQFRNSKWGSKQESNEENEFKALIH